MNTTTTVLHVPKILFWGLEMFHCGNKSVYFEAYLTAFLLSGISFHKSDIFL